MKTAHFRGHLSPLGVKITIENLPPQAWEDIQTKYRTVYRVSIVESVVSVEVICEHYDSSNISDMANRALELTRSAIDIFCYHKGWGINARLDRFIDPDGGETILVPVVPALGNQTTQNNFDTIHVVTGIDNLYKLLAANPTLSVAMNDLIMAISLPRYAEANCFRAVEGIRTLMSSLRTWNAPKDGPLCERN